MGVMFRSLPKTREKQTNDTKSHQLPVTILLEFTRTDTEMVDGEQNGCAFFLSSSFNWGRKNLKTIKIILNH